MNLKIGNADSTQSAELFNAEKICFPNEFWSLDNIKSELDNERNICIAARDEERIIGYIFLSTVCDECELNRIAVLPEYRNQKIAGKLMLAMKDFLSQKSFGTVYLEVRSSNAPAINLYTKSGFKEIGKRKNYYKNPTEDAVLMSLELI